MPSTFRGRDFRIDLLRGLALWMIFADHIRGNLVHRFTYEQIGFSDALEIFVFLSGISCGLVYCRIVANKGFLAAQAKAVRRILLIYCGYILLAFATFVFVTRYHEALGPSFITEEDYSLAEDAPATAYIAASYLYYTPHLLKVLPLYIELVAIVPIVALGLRRLPTMTLAVSAFIWLLAALVPELNAPNLVPPAHGFNPFSWQLLFCLGLWVGNAYYVNGSVFRPIPWVTAACWTIIAASLLGRALEDVTRFLGHSAPALSFVHQEKVNEGLLRLAHFLAVVYLVAGYLRPSAAILRKVWTRPLIWCGQHSLPVFCFGALLSNVATLYLTQRHPAFVEQILVNTGGVALMSALAWFLSSLGERPLAVATYQPSLVEGQTET